jgi:hypothetical protein
MKTAETETSPLMEVARPDNVKINQKVMVKENNKLDSVKGYNYYTYILGFFVIAIVIYLLWNSYSCFYANQDLLTESFLTGTVKTGTDDDIVFDVEGEINKLREMQEKYLNKIKTENN